jgi:hypothetical protein
MCEFNAVELAWAKVKRTVRENNTAGQLFLHALQMQTAESMFSVTSEDWDGYCRHVMKTEEEYWQQDCLMEVGVDEFIIHIDDDSNEDDNNSSMSEDRRNISSESDSSDLAQPLSMLGPWKTVIGRTVVYTVFLIFTHVCGDIILFLNCLHCVLGKNISLKSNKKFAIFIMLELYFSPVDLATCILCLRNGCLYIHLRRNFL